MRSWERLRRRLRILFRRAEVESELSDEIRLHLDMESEDLIREGMGTVEARREARLRLGGVEQTREAVRAVRPLHQLSEFGRDLRYAVRALGRAPSFTLVAVLTLALGVGATTAMFSVVDGTLLRPLPYPDEDRLVELVHEAPGLTTGPLFSSPTIYFGYREYGEAFESVGHWDWDDSPVTVTGAGEPESVGSVEVTHEVLSMLGADPILGRGFAEEDDLPGSPPTAVLSYGYWQRRFGGSDIRDRTLVVNGIPRQVIGVLPQSFRFFEYRADIFYPLQLDRSAVDPFGSFDGRGLARLKPGVTLADANADVRRMIPLLTEEFGGGFLEEHRFGPRLRSLKESVIGDVDETLWTLMGTIGILLAVACANVTNLVLARTRARRPELAIRTALGAGWSGVTRVVLAESIVLGLGGGVLGLGVAYMSRPLLAAVGSTEILRDGFGSTAILPQIMSVTIDPEVVLFALGISFIAALLCALVPAIHFVWKVPTPGSGGRLTHGRDGNRTRDLLVVSQVALALMLLVGSGLMIRSFQALRRVDPGFQNPDTVQTFQITNPDLTGVTPDPLEAVRTQQAILDRLSAVAGVESVGFVTFNDGLPLDGDGRGLPIGVEGQAPEAVLNVQAQYVSPNFFETMQTRLIAGRTFDWTDVYDGRQVVLISDNLARSEWGSATAAVGGRITLFGTPRGEVVGVVENVHHDGIDQPAPFVVAFPPSVSQSFNGMRTASFVVRSPRVGTAGFLDDLREAAWSVDPNVALSNVQTLGDMYRRSTARTLLTLALLLITATISIFLGLVGIYGVVSYLVAQRRREIGIRLALGASQSVLRRSFVKHALAMAGFGVAVGLGAAMVLTRLIESQLFGITALDLPTYVAGAAILVAAAMVASYVPARRASRIDPVEALKAE